MYTDFLEQVKADYSWYGASSNPIKFVCRVFYHRYFRLLFIFRILSNVNVGGRFLLFPLRLYYTWLQRKCMIELPLTVQLGKGATFVHYGPRTIHGSAVIGDYCEIFPCVLIGGQRGKGVPQIGHHTFLGYGSKIIGNVKIGNYVFVCPNSVVVKNIPDEAVVSGIPANILHYKGRINVALYDQTHTIL